MEYTKLMPTGIMMRTKTVSPTQAPRSMVQNLRELSVKVGWPNGRACAIRTRARGQCEDRAPSTDVKEGQIVAKRWKQSELSTDASRRELTETNE